MAIFKKWQNKHDNCMCMCVQQFIGFGHNTYDSLWKYLHFVSIRKKGGWLPPYRYRGNTHTHVYSIT